MAQRLKRNNSKQRAWLDSNWTGKNVVALFLIGLPELKLWPLMFYFIAYPSTLSNSIDYACILCSFFFLDLFCRTYKVGNIFAILETSLNFKILFFLLGLYAGFEFGANFWRINVHSAYTQINLYLEIYGTYTNLYFLFIAYI